ncbi:CBS domain containing-hemolysin-like protein [Aquimarina sp. MAR_2010_214]|uniref:CNNM domain-containing protein n=1 Tax=Aquimarina sp. MAR_2010_214 TaxID=1250026 RepID=UPI000C70A844|nr:CNNM domain-containing protein [Aquimarina sp. MAR_2010_214]PKV49030.1 CBS domain containing-hemolysin-like protein [Aquimarina sp. MAR_2010_214]
MTLLIIYAVLSIFFSFLCSILEAVLLSVTPTFINVKKKEGKAYANTLENLKKDVDQPLIAILTLNTIAHTVGAILVGVQAEQLPYKFEILGVNMVGIVSTIMTLLILVLSEIIPKTIGATFWKQLANFTSKSLVILIAPLKYTGILWVLRLTTKLIGGKGHHGSVLSREDFTAMTDIAHEEGVFEESESKVIKNLLNFKEILAKDIMTPRSVLKIAPEDQNIAEFFKANKMLRFSRIPVYKDNPDHISGYVLKDEVYKGMAEDNHDMILADLKRQLFVVDRNLAVPNLFEKFVEQREHIALVVDEYGSVSGLVTMEDVIETLLGLEIVDESDTDANMQDLARKNWENRARRLGILDDKKEE